MYYLRSSVLGNQVVAEINASGGWERGYVYMGAQLLAIQRDGVWYVHQDPVTKGQRVTGSTGAWVSSIELAPWGEETGSDNVATQAHYQPRRYTTYERDGDGTDEGGRVKSCGNIFSASLLIVSFIYL